MSDMMPRDKNDAEERLLRLPKWAQQEIGRLRRDVVYLEGKLGAGPESNTWADPYTDAPRPLGVGTTIVFVTKGGDRCLRSFTVRLGEDDRLVMQASDSIRILPSASNHFYVELER